MYIRNNALFMAYKVLLVLISLYGFSRSFGPGMWYSLNYYTVLSNLVCLLYFAGSLAYNARRLALKANARTWRPRLEGAVVVCISVTFVIYNFILRPRLFTMGLDQRFWNPQNIIFHYAIPFMAVLDYFLFSPRNASRLSDPFVWSVIPVLYCAYALVRGATGLAIGPTQSSYPYPFFDAGLYGWGQVSLNVSLIAVGIIAMGYLYLFADRVFVGVALRLRRRRLKALYADVSRVLKPLARNKPGKALVRVMGEGTKTGGQTVEDAQFTQFPAVHTGV